MGVSSYISSRIRNIGIGADPQALFVGNGLENPEIGLARIDG